MKKYLLFYMLINTILFSCNSKNSSKIKFDDSIKEEALNAFVKGLNSNEYATNYENQMLIKYFEDDSLKQNTFNEDQMLMFRSNHKVKGDEITMEGAYGIFGGYGYTIKMNEDNVEVFYTIRSNENPAPYSLTNDGELTNFILIPVKNFNLTLSGKPQGHFNEIIYGVVEFESEDYYKMDYQKLHRRQKINTSMKIYFKSLAVK